MLAEHRLNALSVDYQPSRGGDRESRHLVLLHGWGSDSACWQELGEFLSEDFHLWLIDLPGFGRNAEVEPKCLDSLVDEIVSLLPAKCDLIGWSLGGMLATRVAAAAPHRVGSLVTIATNARFCACDDWREGCDESIYKRFSQNFSRAPEATLERFFLLQTQGDTSCRHVLQRLRDNRRVDEVRVPAWEKTLSWLSDIDNRACLARLPVPHLAIFGRRDALVPSGVAEVFSARAYAQQTLVVDNSGHAPHLTSPRQLARRIMQFVLRYQPTGRRSKSRVARSFSRAAISYDDAARLQKQVARDLVSMQTYYQGVIVDLGCGTGALADSIPRTSGSMLIGLDIAEGMLQRCRQTRSDAYQHLFGADIEALPLVESSADGLISSLSVQWCDNPAGWLGECHRVLRPGAWLLFSTLTEGTLEELGLAWREVDRHTHVNAFISRAVLMSSIEEAGFVIEKCEHRRQLLQYRSTYDLMRELKAIGAHNVNPGENAGLTTGRRLKALVDAYEQFRQGAYIPASYFVTYALAKRA